MHHHDEIYVNGSFEPASTAARLTVVNPALGYEIGSVPDCGIEDTDRAILAARVAFDNGPWASATAAERAELLSRLADALDDRAADLAETLTLEGGFPARFVAATQVTQAIAFVRYYASLAAKDPFEETRPGTVAPADVAVRRVPVGVVATLAPWNIPLLGALTKIAPALAAGCTVVHKSAPETPLHSYVFASAIHAAGFPRGVVNLITAGVGGGQWLVSHPDVDMVAFTGSTTVGRQIAQACARDFRRCALELGGNAAAIVLEDAPATLVAKGIAGTGLAINNGEACIAQRRVLVPRSRYDEIVELLGATARALRVGDPADPETVVGPMISARHRDRVLDSIRGAREQGARVVAGGGTPAEPSGGFYVEPTVLADVTNEMTVAREETFGPVVCVIPFDTVDEAVAIARDTEYGLSSSVWSADPVWAAEIGRRLRVGSVYVNGTMVLDPGIPFGGFGHSGIGRELGPEGLDEFCETQAIFLPAARR